MAAQGIAKRKKKRKSPKAAPKVKPAPKKGAGKKPNRRAAGRGENVKKIGKEAFLKAFLSHGSIQGTCDAIGIGRRTVYAWIAKDKNNEFLDALEATRRACDQKVSTSMFRMATTDVEPQFGARNAQVRAARVYGEMRGLFKGQTQQVTPSELLKKLKKLNSLEAETVPNED